MIGRPRPARLVAAQTPVSVRKGKRSTPIRPTPMVTAFTFGKALGVVCLILSLVVVIQPGRPSHNFRSPVPSLQFPKAKVKTDRRSCQGHWDTVTVSRGDVGDEITRGGRRAGVISACIRRPIENPTLRGGRYHGRTERLLAPRRLGVGRSSNRPDDSAWRLDPGSQEDRPIRSGVGQDHLAVRGHPGAGRWFWR